MSATRCWFGRAADCHARLPGDDTLVSRHHFLVEVNPPAARLRDLGSLNGTQVNGQKIGGRKKGETPEQGAKRRHPEIDLKDGDQSGSATPPCTSRPRPARAQARCAASKSAKQWPG